MKRRTICIGLAASLAGIAMPVMASRTSSEVASAAARLGRRALVELSPADQALALSHSRTDGPPAQDRIAADFRAGRTLKLCGAVLSASEIGWFLTVAAVS